MPEVASYDPNLINVPRIPQYWSVKLVQHVGNHSSLSVRFDYIHATSARAAEVAARRQAGRVYGINTDDPSLQVERVERI